MSTKQPYSPTAFRVGASRGYGAGMPQFESPLAPDEKLDARRSRDPAKRNTVNTPRRPFGFSPNIRFRNPADSLKSLKPSSPASSTLSTPNCENSVAENAFRSPFVAANTQQTEACRCQRPPTLIMCTSCGFTFSGRVRTHCFVHPTQIYLMDNESCPQCCSTSLREYNKI